MSDLPTTIKRLLFVPSPAKEDEATVLLASVAGRGPGQFGPRLTDWLNSNPAVYPEPANAEYVDNPQDHGVDVLLTGMQTGVRVGFQIKSENDLAAKDFAQKLKAQITEAVDASLPSDGSISKPDATTLPGDAGLTTFDAMALDGGGGSTPFADATATACPAASMGELCAHGRYYLICGGQPCLTPTDTPCVQGDDCSSPCAEDEFGAWCAQSTPPPMPTCKRVDASAGGVPYCCPCK